MKRVRKNCAAALAAIMIISALTSCGGSLPGSSGNGRNTGNAAQSGETGGSVQSGTSGAAGDSGDSTNTSAQEVVFNPPSNTPSVRPSRKEESVYVKADASGNPTKTEVEVKLTGIGGTDGTGNSGFSGSDGTGNTGEKYPIEDYSILRDVKNTEGDEEYVVEGNHRYLWDNHGEDIHYKGLSDEPLPVDVKVTYYLEGEEVSPDRIAGKSGNVKIRFDYDNRAYGSGANGNGENGSGAAETASGAGRVRVPFLVMSAVILPAEHFSDIEVDNGKVLEMDDQSAVIGYALPGLADSLKLSSYEPTEEIEIPEHVEITARAEEFELDFTATVITTGLFEDLDSDDLDEMEDMADDMKELTDASGELVDAADEIADGGAEIGDAMGQYFDGLRELAKGAGALDVGMQQLQKNSGKLLSGASALEEGLEQMDAALAKVDLSGLSSGQNQKAAAAAAEALKSLSQNTAALYTKLSGIQTTAAGAAQFVEEARGYSGRVETLRSAADEMAQLLGYDGSGSGTGSEVSGGIDGGTGSGSGGGSGDGADGAAEGGTSSGSGSGAGSGSGSGTGSEASGGIDGGTGSGSGGSAGNSAGSGSGGASDGGTGSGSGSSAGSGSGSALDIDSGDMAQYKQEINEAATAQARDAAREAAGKAAADAAAKVVTDAVKEAVVKAAADAAQRAAQNAAEETLSSAKEAANSSVRESINDSLDSAVDSVVDGSGILDDESLGLTEEQKEGLKNSLKKELKDELTTEIAEAASSGLGDALDGVDVESIAQEQARAASDEAQAGADEYAQSAAAAAASGSGQSTAGGGASGSGQSQSGIPVDIDTDSIQINVGDELEDILNRQKLQAAMKLQKALEDMAEANAEVGELQIPDLSLLSGEDAEEIGGILAQMQGALKVVAGYGEGMSSMTSALGDMAKSLEKMKHGTAALSKGSKGLSEGLTAFDQAIGKAAEGTTQLDSALQQVSGLGGTFGSVFGQLVEGLQEFADGVSEFDEEGIRSLADLAGPEYLDVIRGLRAVRAAELSYDNYSGKFDGQEGSVRFIIETDEVKAE